MSRIETGVSAPRILGSQISAAYAGKLVHVIGRVISGVGGRVTLDTGDSKLTVFLRTHEQQQLVLYYHLANIIFDHFIIYFAL